MKFQRILKKVGGRVLSLKALNIYDHIQEHLNVQNLFIKHEVRVHPSDIAVHRGIYDCTEIDINTLPGVTMVTL